MAVHRAETARAAPHAACESFQLPWTREPFVYLAYTPEQVQLQQELRSYFASVMTPEERHAPGPSRCWCATARPRPR
jgi:hypothetical protein